MKKAQTLSGFMIGMVMSFLLVVGLLVTMSNINESYASTSYDADEIEKYNYLDNISADAQNVQNTVENISESQGTLDVIGGYFTSAYNGLRTGFKATNTFYRISEDAREDIGQAVGDDTLIQYGYQGLMAILVIVIFIVIALGILLKARI